jgi:NTE family protein
MAKKVALVISGGGAKGAFAVGVIKHLYKKYRGNGWFSIVGGTSTGALICPMAALMAHPAAAIRNAALDTLVDIYSNVTTPEILEKQDWYEFLARRDCLNESDPLRALIESRFDPSWYEWLTHPQAPDCYVVYTNYRSGAKVVASPKGAPGGRAMTREDFLTAMLASASVPVLMEPVRIGNDACFDGGVRDLLPFASAIDLGAEVIIPISLEPAQYAQSYDRFSRIDKILLRTLSILVDESVRNDAEQAKLINIGVQARKDLVAAFRGSPAALTKINKILNKPAYADLFGKRLLTIVEGLRPDDSLTEDSLAFDPPSMRLWIEQGEAKARQIVRSNPF